MMTGDNREPTKTGLSLRHPSDRARVFKPMTQDLAIIAEILKKFFAKTENRPLIAGRATADFTSPLHASKSSAPIAALLPQREHRRASVMRPLFRYITGKENQQ